MDSLTCHTAGYQLHLTEEPAEHHPEVSPPCATASEEHGQDSNPGNAVPARHPCWIKEALQEVLNRRIVATVMTSVACG